MANLTEANREFFDRLSPSYKTDFAEASRLVFEEVKSRRHWISSKWTDTQEGKEKEIKLLEYACGPGTVSISLEPFVTKIIGVDISEGMVAEFNREVRERGISPEKVSALQGDLLGETVPQHLSRPEFFEFDIVVISAALHHFANPRLAMERLASRLKNGGVFFIIEMLPHHGGEEETHKFIPEAAHTVHKHGFTADEIRELYTHAGVQEKFDLQIVERPFEMEMNGHKFKRTLFMSRGERV